MPRSKLRQLVPAAGLIALAVAPRFVNLYAIALLSDVYMVAAFALALNLIAGFAGYPAFGNVVFFGIGAYATAIAMLALRAPFYAGLAAALVASAAVALIVGPVFFRLRGHYFAIGTLGLDGAVAQLVTNLPLAGGGKGLSLPILPGGPATVAVFFNELFLAGLALAIIATLFVADGTLGIACRALRSDEAAAQSLGIDTLRVKVTLWTISAAITGLLGAVYAYSLTYIEPPDVFNLALSVKAFVIMLLGGAGTLVGPLVAAAFVEGVVALSQHVSLNYDTGVLGIIIVAAASLFPRGVARTLRR